MPRRIHFLDNLLTPWYKILLQYWILRSWERTNIRVLEYSSTRVHELYQSIPCERSELTSLRVRHYRPRRAAGSPSAQRNTPLAPHTIDTALGSPCAPHPARNSIKYRNGCVALKEVGRRPTDCSLRSKPDLKPHFILRNACFIRRITKKETMPDVSMLRMHP